MYKYPEVKTHAYTPIGASRNSVLPSKLKYEYLPLQNDMQAWVNGLEDGMKKTLDITKVVGNEMRMANKG